MTKEKLRLFVSYAREDETHHRDLDVHLKALQNEGLIEPWSDRNVVLGDDWRQGIDENLTTADLVILLISPHFFASDYCQYEMKRARERHAACEIQVLPIMVRPVDWERASLQGLQALPRDASVEEHENPDRAWIEVVKGIREAIEKHADWRSDCLFERVRPLRFTKEILDLNAMNEAAEILYGKVMRGRRGARPNLIVGLNQGGMAVAAIMNAAFSVPAGVIMTTVELHGEDRKVRKRKVKHVALPDISSDPSSVLVVDAKLKSGDSAVQVKQMLQERWPNVDLQFAIVLAYGGWTPSRWEVVDPYFDPLVRFKAGRIDGYVAYYTTMSPNADKIEEVLRPHWRRPSPYNR